MHSFLKGALVSMGLVLGFSLSAQAAPTNYYSCLDVPDEGFGGLSCTVAGNDEFNFGGGDIYVVHTSGNDHEPNVEAALRWVFGEEVDLTGIHDVSNSTPGFDLNYLNSTTVEVDMDDPWTFATVKAATFFIIFDVRDLDHVVLSTNGFIHNDKGQQAPIDISHISFWLAQVNGDGPGPDQVPVPGALALMGVGLVGLGVLRRRRAR